MKDEHQIRTISGGTGIEGWIQPLCKCGWAGRKEYAHNDYQHSNVKEQSERHISELAYLVKKKA